LADRRRAIFLVPSDGFGRRQMGVLERAAAPGTSASSMLSGRSVTDSNATACWLSLSSIAAGTRLVLPSPNGSELSHLAAAAGATVVAGCLRNASAVATADSARPAAHPAHRTQRSRHAAWPIHLLVRPSSGMGTLQPPAQSRPLQRLRSEERQQ
jgi:hypothetical protein